MSTITREFTKEQLQQIIETDHVQCGEASALARIALASLEAEAVCVIDQSNLDYLKSGSDADVWPASRTEMGDVLLYRSAPPVPVSVPDYPETLPCPVMLEPGLKFGKGVHTRTMLGALRRRAEYYAELEAMTPEQRAEHDARMKKFAATLQGAEPVSNRDELPEEKGASLQLRNLIRRRHAEWSDATFGNVGPVGPLKHLSKEALEAAAEPDDLSEWADMQFLLWDAQRRAGICDGEITAAMEKKLKVNMARQWPEPKDGEPRMHINPAPQQEV